MRIFSCPICESKVAEIENGSKIKKEAIFLCGYCYGRMKIAYDIAQQARADTPDFLKNLFGGFNENI